MLLCTKCKETKPVSKFYKHKTNKTGRQSQCKSCCADNHKSWKTMCSARSAYVADLSDELQDRYEQKFGFFDSRY